MDFLHCLTARMKMVKSWIVITYNFISFFAEAVHEIYRQATEGEK